MLCFCSSGISNKYKWLRNVCPCSCIANGTKHFDDEFGRGLIVARLEDEKCMRSQDLERHYRGEFSFAALGKTRPDEHHSQVEVHRNAAFVGIYDGHSGTAASTYVANHLFRRLIKISGERGSSMSKDIIEEAFSETEKGFMNIVRESFRDNPRIAVVGTSCLVGVFWTESLYCAHLGDSKAVLGFLEERTNKIMALDITGEHHTNGLKESRSIGDAHRKHDEFHLGEPYVHGRYYLPDMMSSDPDVFKIDLSSKTDKFVIFASNGLWEFLCIQDAVKIVHTSPRLGIAKMLVGAAMQNAFSLKKVPYYEIMGIRPRAFQPSRHHDDMTVVVVFLDGEGGAAGAPAHEGFSARRYVDTIGGPSNINFGPLDD